MSLEPELKQKIDSIIASDDIVLFMKGNRNFPQCGFSATVVQILNGLVDNYTTVNVLSDPAIRQGIKDYSSWPTIPQLYIRGEFVGGCDIVRELHQSGELMEKLGVELGNVEPPTITITDAAKGALAGALQQADDNEHVRLMVSNWFEHGLELGPKGSNDLEVESNGLTLVIDPISAGRANGVTIDFIEEKGGFKIDNPNAPTSVAQLGPKELKEKLDAGEIKELFDVRTDRERGIATIEGAKPFDDAAMAYIDGLPKDTPIAFHCHTGRRSQSAAEHFRDKGFTRLYNLAGGIDAWSQDVDPNVPRY